MPESDLYLGIACSRLARQAASSRQRVRIGPQAKDMLIRLRRWLTDSRFVRCQHARLRADAADEAVGVYNHAFGWLRNCWSVIAQRWRLVGRPAGPAG